MASQAMHNKINLRLHNFLTVNLERDDFLLQRQQLISVIIGHGSECFFKKATHLLHDFLLHPIKKLARFNPAFIYRLATIGSASSLVSEDILPHMVGANTLFDVWKRLENLFTSQCKQWIMQYKMLQLKKNGRRIHQGAIDTLASTFILLLKETRYCIFLAGLSPQNDSFLLGLLTLSS